MGDRISGVRLGLAAALAVCASYGEERTPEARLDPPMVSPGNQGGAKGARRLGDVSLEELMNIEVSSVGRKEQKLSEAAAAVFVITQEDIRRSGASSVPEALRMAPGVQVAQIDGSKWAISARGFAGRFSNKMLVLIDGRSVYNALYSGVYWDQNDVMMEDIERIEVIRGPGATMWGANAVNGVINIITKHSKDTQGNLISTQAGNVDRPAASARHGGKVGERVSYRTYTKYFNRGDMAQSSGASAYDGWSSIRGGARVDWELNERDSFTAQGDVYRTSGRQSYFNTFPLVGLAPARRSDTGSSGAYALGRWRRTTASRGELALQVYYDSHRRTEQGLGSATFDTADADFQHRFGLSDRHELVWGGGFRLFRSKYRPGELGLTFTPLNRNDYLSSAFVQDEIGLIRERLILTLGSKFLHNSYTGFEVQPSARLVWLASSQQTLWAAVSRAVRTPARIDHDMRVEYAVPGLSGAIGLFTGDRANRSEGLIGYEAGYRHQAAKQLAVDLAVFYNDYDHLKEYRILAPYFETVPVRRLVLPAGFSHTGKGSSYGAEIAGTYQPMPRWKLQASYSWLKMRLYSDAVLPQVAMFERSAPQHQGQVRSSWDVSRRVSLDTSLYYVSALKGLGIPAYVRLDSRLAWRLSEQFELSFIGQNLLDDRHPEFRPEDYVMASEIRRAIFLRLLWLF